MKKVGWGNRRNIFRSNMNEVGSWKYEAGCQGRFVGEIKTGCKGIHEAGWQGLVGL